MLSSSGRGGVTVALNGRVGRRVGCVLDSTGTRLESFDLEGEAEEDADGD
jgi:anaphase-promoting complex subunit 4